MTSTIDRPRRLKRVQSPYIYLKKQVSSPEAPRTQWVIGRVATKEELSHTEDLFAGRLVESTLQRLYEGLASTDHNPNLRRSPWKLYSRVEWERVTKVIPT